MRSPTRTLLVLAVLALAGLAALTWIGRQYRQILVKTRPAAGAAVAGAAPETTRARVLAFLEVRRALKALAQADPEGTGALREAIERGGEVGGASAKGALARWLTARDEVLRRTGLPVDEYRTLVRAVRAWRAGDRTGDPELDAELEAARAQLDAADLGRYERLDD